MSMDQDKILALDNSIIWHPYSSINSDLPIYSVASADGVHLHLSDGRVLVDGMSSWWCAIHGYNNQVMNRAIHDQLERMSHVMFGGLTHEPAVELAAKLVELTPAQIKTVFFADSGSVSVEVAMKMAIQYWYAKKKPEKDLFLTIHNGYHGDTFGAMSVCDPVSGMHSIFSGVLARQLFVDSPRCGFGEQCRESDIAPMEQQLKQNHEQIAAVILEPIVQGAGGMRFYSADYLQQVRELCDRYDVLLILDEIATGFGRTGKMFACEHAGIAPDIMCVGKALTGGYMTLAATMTTKEISETISNGQPGQFMHGPTFMANPLACSAAIASLHLLTESPWHVRIKKIELGLMHGLGPCKEMSQVADVRVLGAIGVVEMKNPVDMKVVQPALVDEGVWVRPFGKLIYLMPPYIINEGELEELTTAVRDVVSGIA